MRISGFVWQAELNGEWLQRAVFLEQKDGSGGVSLGRRRVDPSQVRHQRVVVI